MNRLLRHFRILKAVKVSDELLRTLKHNREIATVRTHFSKITFGNTGRTSRSQKIVAFEKRVARFLEQEMGAPYYVTLRSTEAGTEVEAARMAEEITNHYFPAT